MENNFTKEMKCEGITFRYSRGPSLRKGNEIHAKHELIYYIDGKATLLGNGIHIKLENNTLIFVPKGCFHNFQIENQAQYMRLTASFGEIPIVDEIFAAVRGIRLIEEEEAIAAANAIIKDISRQPFAGQSASVYASFLKIMCALVTEEDIPAAPRKEFDTISGCIEYIDNHFNEDIKISELAKKFYVSQAFIFSEFKKSLGISVHKYITQRRMVYAKQLLEEGKKPTEISAMCGYSDYSTFYKAFVKRFSSPPSAVEKAGKQISENHK